jgi:hypothetical protein
MNLDNWTNQLLVISIRNDAHIILVGTQNSAIGGWGLTQVIKSG